MKKNKKTGAVPKQAKTKKHYCLQVVDRQIVNSLDEIVTNLLMCLYDTEADTGNIR